MSQETKTLSFKDLDFELKKSSNEYFISIPSANIYMDITRFCSKALIKFANMDRFEFNELPIGGTMTGEISCDFHYETETLMKHIDGRDGVETTVVDKTDKKLNQLIIKIFNDQDELYSDEVADHLTDAERNKILNFIIHEYETKLHSGVTLK